MLLKFLQKYFRKVLITFLFSLFFIHSTVGQKNEFQHIGEFGFGLGSFYYMGDLNPTFNMRFHRPAVNIFLRKNLIREVLIFKSQVTAGGLFADESLLSDPLLAQRGHSFNATMVEGSFSLEYDFFDFRNLKDLKVHRIHSPYLCTGIAFASQMSKESSIFRSTKTFYASMILGVGMKIMVTRHLNIGGEVAVRYTFNDEFDGITSDELDFNTHKNDIYFHPNIYLSYAIFRQICSDKARKIIYKQ